MESLESFNEVMSHIGDFDPNGVVRIINSFLLGMRNRR